MNRGYLRIAMSFCKSLPMRFLVVFKTSVKANPDVQTASPNKYIYRKTLLFSKTVSLCHRGSMTVEAALAAPFFLFFIANMLSLLLMYERYSNNLANVHQQAKTGALSAYLMPDAGEDIVSVTRAQQIIPVVEQIGFTGKTVTIAARCRKWTGYNLLTSAEEIEDDEYVYITENGSVYHLNRDCSHLRISIQIIKPEDLIYSRNDNGEIYHKCEKCGNGSSTGVLFITKQGNKFHNNANCSGLKRKIHIVKRKDVEGMPGCGRCT